MKKPAFTLVLCLLLALLTMLRSYAAAADALPHITPAGTDTLDVPCAAAILIDEDSGTVLYEKNADQQRPIASITKVMTLLLTFEALSAGRISLSDTVPVSEHAYHMGGSQIWLEPGEQMTLDDMLKAICISSANDAAVAVAEFVGGSEPAFVQQMNARAAELGLTNTHFENACGLDAEGHLSTARDVAMMSREILLHHAEVRNYCSIWMDSLRDGATQLVNQHQQAAQDLQWHHGAEDRHHQPGGRLHLRQCRAKRPAADCRGAGGGFRQRAFCRRHSLAGLRLCQL